MRPLSELQWQILHDFGKLNVAITPAGVSRQLGRKVERSIKGGLRTHKLTDSQRVSIHRSLRSLVARGLAQMDERHCYSLTDAGLALADAQFPGLAEQRSTETAKWEQFKEDMRQMVALLPARKRRRSPEEIAQARAAMSAILTELPMRRKEGQP